MACLTRLSMIRDRVPSLQNLAFAIRLLSFLTCNNQTKRVSKKQIVDLWNDIRILFAVGASPSFRRLQEALAEHAKKPTDDWIDWFRELARSRDLDAPEVGAIAGAFDAEMDNARQVIAQLPPRFRKALGPDLDFRKQPWAVRARLRHGITLESVETTVQREIEIAGGLEHFVRKCNRWWEIRPLLGSPDWVIEWPDAASLHQRIQDEVDACQARGDLDFSATLDEVKTAVLEILEEARPDWLPSDGSRIKDRHLKLLKAGVLQLPSQLTPLGLRQAVPFAFAPLEIQGQLVERAIVELFDEEVIKSETISHISLGSNEPVPQVIYRMVQPATKKTPVSPDVPPLDMDSSDWVKNKIAAKKEGIGAQTLGNYRRMNEAWVAPDKMSGVDCDKRMWRRNGTPSSQPYYYVPTLKCSREK